MSEKVVSSHTDPWARLDAELNAWASNGQTASFWWRDDDAIAAGEKLDRLFELTAESGLLLACIPSRADKSLATSIAAFPHVSVAQHGYSHTNHAPRGQGCGAWELGLHRGIDTVMSELGLGRKLLKDLVGAAFLPVIVPPWNRIDWQLLDPIAQAGFEGISAFGIAGTEEQQSNLVIANGHCDPIRWKTGAKFAGELKTITQLVGHLEARRSGQANEHEHTGFVTHHLDLDDAAWQFCDHLAAVISSHSGAQWISPVAVFERSL